MPLYFIFRVVMIWGVVCSLAGCKDQRLIHAIESRDVKLSADLIARNVNMNQTDSSGRTPLHIAITSGNKNAFQQLLAAKADPNVCDPNGMSVVHLAAENFDPYWIHEILEHGGDANRLNVGNLQLPGKTPIFYALDRRNTSAVVELIQHGADVNHVDGLGRTPLVEGMGTRAYEAVIELLKAGANPKIGKLSIFGFGYFKKSFEQKILDNEEERTQFREIMSILIERGDLPKPD